MKTIAAQALALKRAGVTNRSPSAAGTSSAAAAAAIAKALTGSVG